jgi:hypothetical protein
MAPSEGPKNVVYLHHTRDRDGEVVFFFLDHERSAEEPLQSSPVTSIRRCHSAVVDRAGHGALGRYQIATQNTLYEVQLPLDKTDHIARELGGFKVDSPKAGG